MKRISLILFTMILAVSMLFPAGAFAADSATGINAADPSNTATNASESAANTETDPYGKQDIAALYKSGEINLPAGVNAEVNANAGGLMFTGTNAAYASDKIYLGRLNFNSNPVSRISVDGLADKKISTVIEIYIDDETDPFARVRLSYQTGKKGWTVVKEKSADVFSEDMTGEHDIYFRIVTSGKDGKSQKVLLRTIEFCENSLPTIHFDIDESYGSIGAMNSDPDHQTECYGSMTIEVPDGYVSEYSGEVQKTRNYELEYIRGRGNSTWYADKKPYKVKLDKKADLLGMGKNKHWILLADRFDNSRLRNKITYWLGDQLGMAYTPKLVPVEVMMNDEYYGTYYLCEQIRIGENRVDIDDLSADEESRTATDLPTISGGYLISKGGFYGSNGIDIYTKEDKFLLESPSFEDYTNDAQLEYIKNYMQQTEDAIYGKDFKNSEGVSYSEFMDVSAAVDYYWIQMFSLNGDAYVTSSTYLYKPRSDKLYWGPLWDFDYVAWGNLQYDEYDVEGLDSYMGSWFNHLINDPVFSSLVIKRWPELKSLLEEATREGGRIDKYYDEIKTAARYDIEKWGSYSEDWSWEIDDGEDGYEAKTVTQRTYKEEVDALRTWINKRSAWVDKHINTLKVPKCKVTFKAGKKTIKKTKIYKGMTLGSGGSLPKAPKKKGYVFKGWYKGSKHYKAGTVIKKKVTLKAKYVKK